MTAAAGATSRQQRTDAESHAPYPGLRPFRQEEAHLFFGREEHVEEMLSRLETRRFLVVVGASGSGKSSLVHAGLFPAIDRGLLIGPEHVRVATMQPRGEPIARLSAALAKAEVLGDHWSELGQPEAFLEATLRRGPRGLVEVAELSLAEAADTGLLIVVDQFEEIFRYRKGGYDAPAAEESTLFVQLLLTAATSDAYGRDGYRIPIYIVLTMRSDYIGACSAFRGLPQAMNDSQFLTPALSREQYRDAIARPAANAGRPLDEALITRLLNELSSRADDDQLPVLQHALMRLWDRARALGKSCVTSDLYMALKPKGAEGSPLDYALSEHCDEVLSSLSAEQAQIAQAMFQMLCEGGTARRDRRRWAKAEAVRRVAGCSLAQLQTVVNAFRSEGRNFVMPLTAPIRDDTILDISHESLIRNWATLRGWLEREAESGEFYRRVLGAAKRYAQGKETLWSGVTLAQAEQWRVEHKPTPAWALRYEDPTSDNEGDGLSLALSFLDKSRKVQWLKRSFVGIAAVVGVATVAVSIAFGAGYVSEFLRQSQILTEQSQQLKNYDAKLQELDNDRLALQSTNDALAQERTELEQQKQVITLQMTKLQLEAAQWSEAIQAAQTSEAKARALARVAEKARDIANQEKEWANQSKALAERELKDIKQRQVGIPSVDQIEASSKAAEAQAPR